MVLTKTKVNADQALKALRSSQNFKAVAKKYSIDQASKSQGGKLPDVTPGQQEKAFDAAIFKAQKGQLVGPVKTQFGYYVFNVTKITPPSQQTLQQARPTIKQLLASQGQQKALNSFVKDFQKKWKGQTNCRKGFVIQLCKNAPKPKTNTSTTPPGAVPQGGRRRRVSCRLLYQTDDTGSGSRRIARKAKVEMGAARRKAVPAFRVPRGGGSRCAVS